MATKSDKAYRRFVKNAHKVTGTFGYGFAKEQTDIMNEFGKIHVKLQGMNPDWAILGTGAERSSHGLADSFTYGLKTDPERRFFISSRKSGVNLRIGKGNQVQDEIDQEIGSALDLAHNEISALTCNRIGYQTLYIVKSGIDSIKASFPGLVPDNVKSKTSDNYTLTTAIDLETSDKSKEIVIYNIRLGTIDGGVKAYSVSIDYQIIDNSDEGIPYKKEDLQGNLKRVRDRYMNHVLEVIA